MKGEIYMISSFQIYPNAIFGIIVEPNYDIETNRTKVDEEVENFIIDRIEAVTDLDLSIHNREPINKIV